MSEEKTPAQQSYGPPEPIKPGDTSMIDMKILLAYLEDMREEINNNVRGISARVALLQSNTIKMRDAVTDMASDFQSARVKRLEEEIAQTEKERGILESRLQILDEQLSLKKTDTLTAVNTTDKIRIAASEVASQTLEAKERLKEAEREELWKKRRESMITAVLTWGSVGLAGSIIAFLWWLFTTYINR